MTRTTDDALCPPGPIDTPGRIYQFPGNLVHPIDSRREWAMRKPSGARVDFLEGEDEQGGQATAW